METQKVVVRDLNFEGVVGPVWQQCTASCLSVDKDGRSRYLDVVNTGKSDFVNMFVIDIRSSW